MAVVVFEKNAHAGGASSFQSIGGEGVPRVCYSMLGLEPQSRLRQVVAAAAPGCEPERMQAVDHVFFPDFDLRLPDSVPAFKAALASVFPSTQASIAEACAAIESIYQSVAAAQSVVSPNRLSALKLVRRYHATPYERTLETWTDDPRLRAVLAARVFSSMNTTLTMGSYLGKALIDGLYSVPGSGPGIATALQAHLASRPNVTLRLGSEVVEVLLDAQGRAVGVRTRDGGELAAETVVLGTDLSYAVGSLLGESETRSALAASIGGGEPSLSAMVVTLLADRGADHLLDPHRHTARLYYADRYDIFDLFRAREAGKFDTHSFKINIDRSHPRLTAIYLELDCPYGARPANIVTDVIAKLERVFPTITRHIVDSAVTMPAEFERLTNSRGGSTGWKDSSTAPHLPDDALARWNLLHVGQRSRFGPGIAQLEASAEAACRFIRRDARQREASASRPETARTPVSHG